MDIKSKVSESYRLMSEAVEEAKTEAFRSKSEENVAFAVLVVNLEKNILVQLKWLAKLVMNTN